MILPSALESAKKPRVAVVGRPNVGKSTLCNRLSKTRRSITDPTPGVTRDPVESAWEVMDRPVILVDTGGVTSNREGLDELISSKAMQEMQRADVVLLLLDVTEQTAEDEEIIRAVRPFSEKLIVLANKVDNDQREKDVWNLLEYGFADILPISAEHALGIDDVEQTVFDMLAQRGAWDISDENDDVEEDTTMRIGILGQPNTGKSTLINKILNEERSIVSEVAGTTRDIVEGRFRFAELDWIILDTAGIRRKRRIQEDVEYYSVSRAIGVIADSDVVFLMVDARKGLSDQDKKIAWQVVKHGRGVILVLNKWDLMADIPNQLDAVRDRIQFLFPILQFAPVLPLSALQGVGVEDVLKVAIRVKQQLQTRIETGVLNRYMRQWVEETPPPTKKGRRWKVRYITQVSVAPVRFVLFVNRTNGFPESYQRYILNRIRSQFGIQDIPVAMDIQDSRG